MDELEYNSFVYVVTYRNQLEVAPLKKFFFLAFWKLDTKDSFGYNKEIERMIKTFPATQGSSNRGQGWGVNPPPLVGGIENLAWGYFYWVLGRSDIFT